MRIFITGTDTDIGKTYVTIGLSRALQKTGATTIALKPLASGAREIAGRVCNEDALALQKNASVQLPYEHVNPFLYSPAIAPHIAAAKINKSITVSALLKALQPALKQQADFHLIEGVGGLFVPLNENESLADFVRALHCNVIVVVGMKLGCLNHALLTIQALKNYGIDLLGWVANCIDPNMCEVDENIATLKRFIKAPCLGVIDYQQAPETALQLDVLFQNMNITG